MVILASACQVAAPDLSTTDQPLTIAAPLTHDFGSLQVGQTSAPFTFSINPAAGNNDDTITAVTAACPDFVISAAGLPANVYRVCTVCATAQCIPAANALICTTTDYANYTFTVAFRPIVGAPSSCVINVAGTSPKSITVTGTGTLPPIDIDVQPSSLAFGDVRRNTASTAAAVAVRNLGGQTLTVSSVTISSGFAIVSGPTSNFTVAPGGSMGLTATCNPTAVGAMSGQLVVTSNDPATPTVTVPLSCNGVDSALDISPSPLVFPTTRVGEAAQQVITLRNSGSASMTIDSVGLTGTDLMMVAAPGAGTVLGVNATAQVRVGFGATGAGSASGTLTVMFDSGQARTAQISATALTTSMALTPDGDVDLGPVCVGQSKDQLFKVIANEQGPFKITSVTAPAAPFTIAAPSFPATVQGAGVNHVDFTVTAAPLDTGVTTSTLSVNTDIPGATPRDIHLSVVGLPAGVSPTPAAVDFGSTAINSTTIGQSIQVTNCGTTPVTLTNPRLEGMDPADFAIVAQPTSLTVPSSGVTSWLVVAQPHASGPKSAMFSVDHPGGTVTVTLDAEGLAEGVGPGGTPSDGPASYYACSTGTPSASWPIALALAALLVPRRRRTRQ